MTLIEAGPRLLPSFGPSLSLKALRQLMALGVDVRLGLPVTAIHEGGVEFGGERLRSHNVIWAAGVRAAPVVQSLGADVGPGGRVKVQPDCSIPGHPNVFVIGDAAHLLDPHSGQPVPGVSQGALQMGRYVARVIHEGLKGGHGAREAGFQYRDLGSMATIGKSRAVAEIGPLRFSGFPAWLAWLALHITVLIGFRNRISVLVSWIYSYAFFRRGSRLITRSSESAPVAAPSAGASPSASPASVR